MNPHVSTETEWEELISLVKEEPRILFPMAKRRDMLSELKQKTGQLPSDYYLLLKDTAFDCELHLVKEESLLCHLFIRGLLPREEKLRENIVMEAKVKKLRDEDVLPFCQEG